MSRGRPGGHLPTRGHRALKILAQHPGPMLTAEILQALDEPPCVHSPLGNALRLEEKWGTARRTETRTNAGRPAFLWEITDQGRSLIDSHPYRDVAWVWRRPAYEPDGPVTQRAKAAAVLKDNPGLPILEVARRASCDAHTVRLAKAALTGADVPPAEDHGGE